MERNSFNYISICSGIESATVAWEPLGFSALAFAEIEKFPAKLLAHHYPRVPNIGDMLLMVQYLRAGLLSAPDVLVGGTPCQSYSVAGKRLGLEDPRGQLTLAYVDILNTIDEIRGKGDEAVCVWENVPGVLSDVGNAFGQFLGKLAGEDCALQPAGKKWTNAGCVFGPQRTIAWRVVDAQYFGVAQRRRRVYLVASARADTDVTKILFEFEGVRRDIAPGRPEKKEASNTFRLCAFGEYIDDGTASTMKARDYKDATDLVVGPGHKVRRLMPVECERLQGFKDGYTDVPSANDTVRYKALGNSKAVPCIAFVGARVRDNLRNKL